MPSRRQPAVLASLVATLVALAAVLAAAPAGAATSLPEAQRAALRALGVRGGDGAVVVFRALKPLRPGTRITAAGRRTLPATAGAAQARERLLRDAGVSVVRAPQVARVGPEPAWLFYADEAPYQAYQHPGRVALVGVRTGRVTLSRRIDWPPLVAGRLPYFLRSAAGYRNPRTRAFARLYRLEGRAAATASATRGRAGGASAAALFGAPTGLRALGQPAGATDGERQAAAQLAAGRSCAVRVGDTLGNFYDATAYDQTRARLGALFNRLAGLDAGFVSARYRVRTGTTLARFVAGLVDGRGCRDVFLYLAGGGYVRGGEPAVSVGVRGRADGRVEQHVVTASMLRAIVAAHPSATFALQLDAPGSGAFLDALRGLPNLVLFVASAGAGQGSFSALPALRDASGATVPNATNPDALLEFSNRGLRGLACFLERPDEIARAARARADGRTPSYLAWMLWRGLSLCADGSFLDRLRPTPSPVVRPLGFDPDAPEPPASPTGNRAPVAGDATVRTAEDAPVAFTLPGADADGDALSYAVQAPPSGAVSGGDGAQRTFAPAPDAHGVVRFGYAVTDGRATATGSVTVEVTPVDDPPVVTPGDGAAAFVEDGPEVAVAPALAVADVDGDPVDGAVVAIVAGREAGEDELRFAGAGGIAGAWDAAAGELRLSGRASAAEYQAALRSVMFANGSQDPSEAPRTIRFVVTAAGADSAPATRELTVAAVSEPPVLAGAPGAPLTFVEGAAPLALAPALTVSDPDDATLAGAEVRIAAGYQVGADELRYAGGGGIAATWDAAEGVLRLTGSASVGAYETALRAVGFANESQDPTGAARTVTLRAADADGFGPPVTVEVDVQPVNDAPTLGGGSATTPSYAEDDPGVELFPSLVVADADSPTLAQATLTAVAGWVGAEDELLFDDQAGIAGSWDAASRTLTLTGPATPGAWQAALRSVRYRNADRANPTPGARTLELAVSDGALASGTASATVTVSRTNDAPTLGGAGGTAEWTEGDAAGVAVAPALTVSDVDDATLAGATVAIDGGLDAGADELLFTDQSGIAGAWDGARGVLTLTGSASVADYQVALRSVRFRSAGDAPSAAARSVAIAVRDGAATSAPATVAVAVRALDDPPALGGGGASVAYAEGDATGVEPLPGATVSDSDDATLAGATVSIVAGYASGQDELAFADGDGIAGAWDAASGTLRLTGSASLAAYEAALRRVRYRNGSANPSTGARTVSATVENGRVSNSIAGTVTIAAVNDAPRLVAGGGTATFSEADGTPVAVDAGVVVSDADDAALEGATVTIADGRQPGADELLFTNQNGISGAWNAATGVLTLTGSASVADYQAALRSVRYRNGSEDPSAAQRRIELVVDDGEDASAAVSVAVDVVPADDPPALATSPGATSWGGADVPLDAALTVTDPDSATLTGATLRFETGYQPGEDELAFADAGGIAGSWDAATGTLTLTGTASHATWQAALRTVAYRHVGGTQTAVTRTVRVTVTDGARSASATKDVTLGRAPVVTQPAGTALAYVEDDPATPIAPGLTLADEDSPQLAGATVTIESGHAGAEDVLSATVGATGIAASYAAGTLRLTGAAPVADYEAVLRTVAYRNASQDPSTATRTVRFAVTDGSLSGSATRDVAVSAANDAPLATAGGGATPEFVEAGAPVAVDPGLLLADVDDATLASATVTITTNHVAAEDRLEFADQSGIVGSYANGVLTLVGVATVADYQAALRSVTYRNVNVLNPSTAARTVAFVVNDGGLDSAPATATVAVRGVDDPPQLVSGATLAYAENDPATAIDPALTLADADTATMSGATVTIGAGHDAAEDVLTFVNTASIVGTFDRAAGRLVLAGTDTVASYQAALRSVRYSNASEDPSGAPRTVTFAVDDGAGGTVSDDATVTVAPVNDAPAVAGESATAVGNTWLAYGAAPTSDPTRAVSGDVTANDSDVDSPGPLALDVAGSSTTGDRGGTVTWAADGSFRYLPAAGFTGTERLTYRVSDGESTPATAPGTVTVTVAGRVFYVRNDAAGGNDGRAPSPFRTLAAADAAATAPNDRIYVFRGDGTTTGLGGGASLLAGQELIGEGRDLAVSGETLYDSAANARPTLSGPVALDAGNLVTGLNLQTAGGGAPAIAGGAGDRDGTLRDVAVAAGGADAGLVLNGTSGAWTVEDVAIATAGGDGLVATNAGSLALVGGSTVTVDAGGAGRALALSGTTLSGQLDAVRAAGSTGTAIAIRDTLGAIALDGVQVTATGSATGLLLDSANGVVVGGGSVTAGATAVDLRTDGAAPATAPQVTLASARSTGGATGIALDDAGAARVTIAGGALSGQSAAAVSIRGGSGDVAYGGSIGDGAGLAALIQNRTGGAIALSGAVADGADPGGGIQMSGNSAGSTTLSGSSKRLSTGTAPAIDAAFTGGHALRLTGGGLDVDTTSGAGLRATSGNVGAIAVTGAGNTIASGTGTPLTIAGPDIEAAGVTLQSIASNGAPSGIVLADTGSAAGLSVTGTGGVGSGGTIQGSTGPGVQLTSTSDVRLASVNVTGGADDGVRATGVAGLALTGSSQVTGNGDAVTEHGLDLTATTGAVTLTGATVTGNGDRGVSLVNDAGAVTATVTGGTYGQTAARATGSDAVFMEGTGGGSMGLAIDGARFSESRSDHVQVTTDASTTVAQTVSVTNSTFANTVGSAGGSITLNPGGNARMEASLTGNTSNGARDEAITIDSPGSRSSLQPVAIDATIANNQIGTAGVSTSGASAGNGIGIRSNGGASVRALVTGNTVRQYVNFAGIYLVANDGDGTLDATVTGNTVTELGFDGTNRALNGIHVLAGGADAAERPVVCLDVGGAGALANAVATGGTDAIGEEDIRVRQRDASTVLLRGYAGGSTDLAAVRAYLAGRNGRDGVPSVGASATGAPGGYFDTPGGAACAQP